MSSISGADTLDALELCASDIIDSAISSYDRARLEGLLQLRRGQLKFKAALGAPSIEFSFHNLLKTAEPLEMAM
jgi:hypothetical protein